MHEERSAKSLAPLAAIVAAMIVVATVTFLLTRGGSDRAAEVRAAPIVVGLHHDHPLSETQVGELLMGELGCAACHTHPALDAGRSKSAPDLSDVGSRVDPSYLRRFIADPGDVHPGTTMPQALTGKSSGEREQIADAITAFLVGRATAPFSRVAIDAGEADRGEALFHSVGCIACHAAPTGTPRGADQATRGGVVDLEHVPAKYGLDALASFLHQPLETRHSGRMPDMGLETSEARAIASYLLRNEATGGAIIPVRTELADLGMAHFESFGCVSCHEMEGLEPPPLSPLSTSSSLEGGCLSPRPRDVPNFHLDEAQLAAIRAALRSDETSRDADAVIASTMTAFNCIACHERDGYGGVSPEIDEHFQTSEPSLGNEARISPPLTDVGDKLKPEWVHRLMFDGARVRPYMNTRMPQYGEDNLGHLVALFEKADRGEPFDVPVLQGDAAREQRDAARLLLGTDGLACISCHNFNGKDSPGFKGIDLITSTERLHASWFRDFLIAPQDHRPGIVMPQSWPGGVAVRDDVLEGDTDAQIRAIWSYLAEGRTARDPVGIRSEPTVLTVTDSPRVYRGRSAIAGYRGIAVGFPGGLNYAFDAETGSLAALWRGGFVRVRWDGQGAGDFNSASRSIPLPRDVGLLTLESPDQPWPLRPVMTEDNPVNPDPLYPRRLGYRFDGYELDDDRIPTLMYRMGEVSVRDRSVAAASGDSSELRRTIKLAASEPATLHLRVLTGDIEERAPGEFVTPDLRVSVAGAETVTREMPGEEPRDELLVEVRLSEGEATVELTYEPLR